MEDDHTSTGIACAVRDERSGQINEEQRISLALRNLHVQL
jgi:hypothetical protein